MGIKQANIFHRNEITNKNFFSYAVEARLNGALFVLRASQQNARFRAKKPDPEFTDGFIIFITVGGSPA